MRSVNDNNNNKARIIINRIDASLLSSRTNRHHLRIKSYQSYNEFNDL